ncbi:MAG: UvrD-helicase domain-containing protein [Curvibacter sp.]|nr:UvrD-helicase domain-containing protein [Curvibacter sp.]
MSTHLPPSGSPGLFPAPADSPLLASLNAEQRAAVALPPEPALILAGAGSGKTRVLTTRIAWLLQTGQVSPGGVLAVTFTNKAAREMMTRLQSMLPVNVRGMWIGTFHGLCNRLLRAHHRTVNLPATFQILDTQDQLSAIKRLCKQFHVDEERFPPKQLAWFIAGCKEEGLRPNMVPAGDPDTRKKVEIYQLYEDQCMREGVVDFGELLLRSYELLRDNEPVREHYQRRFRHILIDEFQDTNKLQYAWIKLLAGCDAAGYPRADRAMGAVFAVGDDDQSIYAFRGARVGNMADFVREFSVQHQIKLEQNYRSHSNILDTANALISHNKHRLGKNLRTDQGAGEPVRVYEAVSDFAEAQWMIDEMKQLIREGTSQREIAVLYRSNAQSRVIETALFNASIPYRVYGGLRFFERAEIKHALAYLRLLENPADDTSFLRVVNFPPRGIGARSIEQLQDAARTANTSLHNAVGALSGKAGANIGAFVAKIDVLREQTQGLTLREIIELVLQHSGLIEHYQAEREGADRIENLEELVTAAESFVSLEGFGRDAEALREKQPGASAPAPADEAGSPFPSGEGMGWGGNSETGSPDFESGEVMSPLAAFLTHAALEAGDNQAQEGQEAVQLMTVHASKGLEFDVVFITGLEEGLFPHENSMSDFDGLEEERRLMYVAITRARQRLYLSHSQTRMLHGRPRDNMRSRFFDELPEATLKWITPKNQGFGSGFAPPAAGYNRQRESWGPGWQGGSTSGYSGGYPGAYGRDAGATRASDTQVVQQAQEAATGLRVGMQVFHNKFGEGKVLTLEGSGDDARAQISFPRHGTKWLALSVAKLTPVS